MPVAFLLALAAIAGGTMFTYLYDARAPLLARLCAGVCTGFASLALVGFVIASFVGLNAGSLLVAGAFVALPLLRLLRESERARVIRDARAMVRDVRDALTFRKGTEVLLFFVATMVLCWWVFAQAMFETPEGVFTGLDNNLGDLPFHIGIITGFVEGENFPPEHPEFAGARLTYPFLADFLTAIFMRAGASLEAAMFWQNFLLALSFVGLLFRWSFVLTRNRTAALITPIIVLFNGGLGFWRFFTEAASSGRGVLESLGNLTSYYTMAGEAYKWGNAVVMLLVPQRGLLLGFPIALIVWTVWWERTAGVFENENEKEIDEERIDGQARAVGKRKARRARKDDGGAARLKGKKDRAEISAGDVEEPSASQALMPMLIAGAIAGLLPLVHAHSFVVLMLMGACLAVLFCLRWPWTEVDGEAKSFFLPRWKEWAAFFAGAMVVAVPQMLWATYKSDVQAASFFGWQVGWDRGTQSIIVFWLKNTGLFIPLLVAAMAWRGRAPVVSRRLLLFWIPFALCFIVPNLFRLSPWIWDNIKILFYWWIASAPLVALLLARLWKLGVAARASALALLVAVTLAGALDVWRVASGAMRQNIFTQDGVRFAELVKRETAPRSLILHAPTYNHPVYLTGRRSLMGYAGHLGSHGLEFAGRERDVVRIYSGGADAEALIGKYGVDYIVVGPLERQGGDMARMRAFVNEAFLQRYRKVGEAGGYSLYKTSQ